MICAMYLRKSRADMEAEARGEGETLARHESILREFAARQKLQVIKVYREVVSGDTISDRPEMTRMLAAVEQGEYDAVLCMDIDRLGRGDGTDQAVILKTMKYSETIIITPYKTYDARQEMDEEFLEYAQFMARGEYKRIKRRMWAGRIASAKEGKWQSPKAPFGYRRIRIEKGKGWTLAPDPDEAKAVQKVFEWYGSGDAGKNIIANRLNAMGFRTLSGREFSPSTIRNILSNPVYVGKVRWNYRRKHVDIRDGAEVHSRPLSDECFIADGIHPPIISMELWESVQYRLAGNGESRNKAGTPMRNPLAGLMVCGECGKAMVYTPEYRRKVTATYRCSSRGCKTSGIDVECVYTTLLNCLREWVDIAAQSKNAQKNKNDNSEQIKAANSNLAQLKGQLSRLQDLLETGVYSVETYLERSKIINDRISAIKEELSRLSRSGADDANASIIRNAPQIENLLSMWQTSTPQQLNDMLKSVIKKIVYHKTVRCSRSDTPSNFLTLEVFPKIEK